MISICKSKRKSNPSSVFTGLQNLGHIACAIHLKVVDIRSKREKWREKVDDLYEP